jgi:molecular chaperone HscB
LKDPLKRAAYLCELHGADVDPREQHRDAAPASWIQQMEWREALDEAKSLAARSRRLPDEVTHGANARIADCSKTFDERPRRDRPQVEQVRALMFVERFADDIDQRLDALGQ